MAKSPLGGERVSEASEAAGNTDRGTAGSVATRQGADDVRSTAAFSEIGKRRENVDILGVIFLSPVMPPSAYFASGGAWAAAAAAAMVSAWVAILRHVCQFALRVYRQATRTQNMLFPSQH